MYDGEIVGVELPAAVELTVTETEPGMQGDRVSGARKPATLETGLVVQVPLFVNTGDLLKVDTRYRRVPDPGLTARGPRPADVEARRPGVTPAPGTSRVSGRCRCSTRPS